MITPAARFYLGFYRDVLWRLLVFSIADILQPFVLILILIIVRYSIDKLIAHGKLLQLLFMILGIIGLYLISGGVNLLVRYFSLHITDGPIQQFHEEILKRVYSFSRQYYTRMDRKQLHTILVRDMTQADIMINALIGKLVPGLLVSLVITVIRNRSDPPPQPSPTRGEGVIAKQLLSVFPLPLWEGVRGRGVNAYRLFWFT